MEFVWINSGRYGFCLMVGTRVLCTLHRRIGVGYEVECFGERKELTRPVGELELKELAEEFAAGVVQNLSNQMYNLINNRG